MSVVYTIAFAAWAAAAACWHPASVHNRVARARQRAWLLGRPRGSQIGHCRPGLPGPKDVRLPAADSALMPRVRDCGSLRLFRRGARLGRRSLHSGAPTSRTRKTIATIDGAAPEVTAQASDQSTVATVTGSASPFTLSARPSTGRKASLAALSASKLAMISSAVAAAAIRAVICTPRPM